MAVNNAGAKSVHHLAGVLALVLVALLWGTTFAVVRGTLEQISPALEPGRKLLLSGFSDL